MCMFFGNNTIVIKISLDFKDKYFAAFALDDIFYFNPETYSELFLNVWIWYNIPHIRVADLQTSP